MRGRREPALFLSTHTKRERESAQRGGEHKRTNQSHKFIIYYTQLSSFTFNPTNQSTIKIDFWGGGGEGRRQTHTIMYSKKNSHGYAAHTAIFPLPTRL